MNTIKQSKIIFTYFNLIICFLFFAKSTAQKHETIIVYDTIVVYDTIHIHKIQKAILKIDTITHKSKLIAFYGKKNDTIPINDIIINENINNLHKMKKITFLALMTLSFQQMVLAQTDFGVTVGNNFWRYNTTQDTLSTKYSYGPQIGVYSSTYLTNKLSLRMDLQYSYLVGNKNNKISDDNLAMYNHYTTSNYHQFSLPIKLVLTSGKFKNSIGFYYNHALATTKLKGLGEDPNKGYSLTMASFGATIGTSYDISKKIALNLNYLIGLHTQNLNYRAKNDLLNITNYSPRSNQFNIGLSYKLSKDKNKNE